jgi:hypothetical protein
MHEKEQHELKKSRENVAKTLRYVPNEELQKCAYQLRNVCLSVHLSPCNNSRKAH